MICYEILRDAKAVAEVRACLHPSIYLSIKCLHAPMPASSHTAVLA